MDVDEDAPSRAGSSTGGTRRRSSRAAVVNSRKRPSEAGSVGRNGHDGYRGERRSTRLGNAPTIAFDEAEQALLPPSKRARSSVSAVEGSDRAVSVPAAASGSTSAAAAGTGPELVVVPPPAGKKKSKFWYYAVEPVPGTNGSISRQESPAAAPVSTAALATPGGANDDANGYSTAPSEAGVSLINGMEGVELSDVNADGLNGNLGSSVNGADDNISETNNHATKEVVLKPVSSVGSAMQMSDDDS